MKAGSWIKVRSEELEVRSEELGVRSEEWGVRSYGKRVRVLERYKNKKNKRLQLFVQNGKRFFDFALYESGAGNARPKLLTSHF